MDKECTVCETYIVLSDLYQLVFGDTGAPNALYIRNRDVAHDFPGSFSHGRVPENGEHLANI